MASKDLPLLIQRVSPDAQLPVKNSDDDAGSDCFVRAFAAYDITTKKFNDIMGDTYRLLPYSRIGCRLGFKTAIPKHHYVSLLPRSGLAMGYGIITITGTIDSSYRGEWIAIIFNASPDMYVIQKGDKICQMVLLKYEQYTINETDNLSESLRGEKGFGSSGK